MHFLKLQSVKKFKKFFYLSHIFSIPHRQCCQKIIILTGYFLNAR